MGLSQTLGSAAGLHLQRLLPLPLETPGSGLGLDCRRGWALALWPCWEAAVPPLPSMEDPTVTAVNPWPCAGFPFASPGGDDSISHTTASCLTKSVLAPDTVCAAHAPQPCPDHPDCRGNG